MFLVVSGAKSEISIGSSPRTTDAILFGEFMSSVESRGWVPYAAGRINRDNCAALNGALTIRGWGMTGDIPGGVACLIACSFRMACALAIRALARSFINGFHRCPLRDSSLLDASFQLDRIHFSTEDHARLTRSPLVRLQSSPSRNASACHCMYVLKSQLHFSVRDSVSMSNAYSTFSRLVMNNFSRVSSERLLPPSFL